MGEEILFLWCESCGARIEIPEAQQFSLQPVCPKCGEIAPLKVVLDEGFSVASGETKIVVSPPRLRELADTLEKVRPTKSGARVIWALVNFGSVHFIWEPAN